MLSRSGGTSTDAVEHRAVDAADAEALARAAAGADVLYNAVNPAYHRWPTDWPPVAAALLTAAERTGAVLVTMGNLYGYGRPSAPMTPETPLAATDVKGRVRNRMWADALAAHEAGRVRVTEARAADFVGPAGPRRPVAPDPAAAGAAGRPPRLGRRGPRRRAAAGPTCPTSPPRWPPSAPTSGRWAGPGTCPPPPRAPSGRR